MISQSDLLRACRVRTPDSFAPDGEPLFFIPASHVLPYHYRRRAPTIAKISAPHALVPVRDQTLSSITDGFAAAGDSTASNLVSPDPVENFSHTDRTEGVTHRDLSQHADTCVSNRNEIVVPHGSSNT